MRSKRWCGLECLRVSLGMPGPVLRWRVVKEGIQSTPEANAVLKGLRKLPAVHHQLLGHAAAQHAGAPGASRHVRGLPGKRHLADSCLDTCTAGEVLLLDAQYRPLVFWDRTLHRFIVGTYQGT